MKINIDDVSRQKNLKELRCFFWPAHFFIGLIRFERCVEEKHSSPFPGLHADKKPKLGFSTFSQKISRWNTAKRNNEEWYEPP